MKMATMVSMFWVPNTTGAVPMLSENLLGFRNVVREIGYSCDTVALIPGGGGVSGEMGLVMNFEGDQYAEWLSAEPDARMTAYQQSYEASDSKPSRSSTLLELPETEVAYDDLPKGFVQASIISVLPGKIPEAIDDLYKSQKIMARLGITARALRGFLSDPSPIFVFIQYFDSAASWDEKGGALFQDEEWNEHFGRSHENRQIVRNSAYNMLP
jgi:hypothetical protein